MVVITWQQVTVAIENRPDNKASSDTRLVQSSPTT